ncbi:MAG: gamma carbonic anhydrase family protein [Anaerolineae bacterium]
MEEERIDCERHPEKIHPSVFIADTATVLGDVTIGKDSSIWYSAVVRGDVEHITIGERCNIQDGAIVHCDFGFPTIIGNGVALGHGAVVHGARLEDNVLVGMKAVVLNGAVVGENSIVGAGAVVTPGTVIPPNSLVLGVPGKVVRSVPPEQAEENRERARVYMRLARAHKEMRGTK